MRIGIRALVRLSLTAPIPSRGPSAYSRRHSARLALGFGFATLVCANLALALVIEFSHREWRDPEFAHRLNALCGWKSKAPQRPLVLALGSSRIQQGIDPSSMGLGEGPTDPLVFNFGYRGASPVIIAQNFLRILDSGTKPDFVLIEFSPASISGEVHGPGIVRKWANRFTVDDLHRFHAMGSLDFRSPTSIQAVAFWLATNATPWTTHRQVLLPHLLPDWVAEPQRIMLGGERMDRYGFTSMQMRTTTTSLNRADPDRFREQFARVVSRPGVSASSVRAYSLLLARCREEGIPVAVIWTPLAPLLEGWLNPELRQSCHRFATELNGQPGVIVIPPPDWLTDNDFADGQHLLPEAAARYSRWLAETQLRPWLAKHAK